MSASRFFPASETNLSGRLFVQRAYGSGVSGPSASLGGTPGTAQSYSGSQVLVSTGRIGTGYIRINANPQDDSTPFIDIVERTGSGIYAVDLKARLGDLSGLSGTSKVLGRTNPGFGLATDNVYLQGGINATFGNIGGFAITRNAITGSKFFISGSAPNSGVNLRRNMFISASNFNVKGNGDVTASNALFAGVALANVIRDKTIIINNNNSSSYFQTIDIEPGAGTTNATRLVLDGTLGGERVRRVRLNIPPPFPLGDFRLPGMTANSKIDFTIEAGITGVSIYDIFTNRGGGAIIYPPDSVTLTTGATITFTVAGTSADEPFFVAGTENPFDYVFKRDVRIGDGDGDGGTLLLSGSGNYTSQGFKLPQLVLKTGATAGRVPSTGEFEIRPAYVTTTTATTIAARTLGNFESHFQLTPGGNVIEPWMAMSASINTDDRRVLISSGLHTSFRQSAGTFTVGPSDYFIEHTAATNQTVTLPSAVGIEAGRQLLITKLNSGGTLTVSASGTDRIVRAGAATPGRRTTQQYAFAQYFCNGEGEWYAAEQGTWAG
jgi:hypothetical protein